MSLGATATALGRYKPQGGFKPPDLSWFRETTDRAAVLRLYHATQNPPDCSRARYTIIDDFEPQSGMGFSFLVLQAYLQQAVQEGRVLVFASAVLQNATWRWCNEGPMDFSCYFEPWSHCEEYLTARYPLDARSLPRWSYHSGTGPAQFVYNAQRTDAKRPVERDLYRAWDSACCARYWNGPGSNASIAVSPMGKSWWLGMAWDMLLTPKAFVERAASEFLASKGVGPDDRFIVAVVRHGGKHADEKEVQVGEYEAPLVKLAADDCIGTPNVLIVTETASVIRQFGEICSRRGWNCFASDQNRTDMDYDYWNPLNRKTRGVGSLGHALPQSEVLSHIGWHSVLNLVVSRRGSALVGSIQSQWAMATLGMMRRYHGRAVTLCSLRPGWRTGHFYNPDDAAYFGENCKQTFPACTQPVSHGAAHSSTNVSSVGHFSRFGPHLGLGLGPI